MPGERDLTGTKPRAFDCRSCGAPIYWTKTVNDKNIPVDPDEDGEPPFLVGDVFDRETMTTHFETCPNAQSHRKPKEA